MKIPNSYKKVLATILSASLMASAIGASIQANAELPNLIGTNGTFESAVSDGLSGWKMYDNYTEDTLTLGEDVDGDKALQMTKGNSALADNGWVTLASPIFSVIPGYDYVVTYDSMGLGKSPKVINTVQFYNDDETWSPNSSVGKNTFYVSDDWDTSSFTFTAPEGAYHAELRIVFQGNAGDSLFLDNVVVNPPLYTPSIEKWNYGGYNDPNNAGISDISLIDDGYLDKGSIRFESSWANNDARSTASIANLGTRWQDNTTYVFSAWIKGRTYNPDVAWQDKLAIELGWSLGIWKDTETNRINVLVSNTEWTQVEYEFTTTTAAWSPIIISAGGYSDLDFYMDDIVVYKKDDASKDNALDNGKFATITADSLNLIPKSDMEDNSISNVDGFSLVNINAEVVNEGAYDGNQALRVTGKSTSNGYLQSTEYNVGEGDTVTISGYYKAEDGEPNAWINRITAYGSAAPTGLHPGEDRDGETFTEKSNGWIYFERTMSVKGYKKVSFLYGVKSNGSALFDNISANIECNVEKGDVNADSKIDVSDLIRLKKYIADNNSVCISSSSDFNNDKVINSSEIIMLKKYLMGAEVL